MSTEPPSEPTTKPKGKLKDALDKGGLPEPTKPDPKKPDEELWNVAFDIKEEDKTLTQENFDKLQDSFTKLAEYTVKKDVMAQRDKILEAIKARSPEIYELEKDNQTINELQSVLRTLSKITPSDNEPDSGRQVGAVVKDKEKEAPKTQYSHLKDEFVSG